MNKICTSIEQSKKLIELGIDVNTADMCWCSRKLQWGEIKETIIAYPMLPNEEKSGGYIYVHAWSLSALLELMPTFTLNGFGNGQFNCRDERANSYALVDTCPLDAAFEMICWLLENGKL